MLELPYINGLRGSGKTALSMDIIFCNSDIYGYNL